jgi:hypothetical protein
MKVLIAIALVIGLIFLMLLTASELARDLARRPVKGNRQQDSRG